MLPLVFLVGALTANPPDYPRLSLILPGLAMLAALPLAWLSARSRTGLGLAVGATVLIESTFQLNGLGYLFTRSLTGQDYATVLALFLLASVACLTSALLAEALDGDVDPASPVEAVPRIDGA